MSILESILDNDLYKFTMAQAVGQTFPYAQVRYKFINRGGTKFSSAMATKLQDEVDTMARLKLTDIEKDWLKENCPYLSPVYIDLLGGYRYNPCEVYISCINGNLEVEIEGPWYRTIYWEVPIMALISELHNKTNKQPTQIDINIAKDKAKKLNSYAMSQSWSNYKALTFADFGTRRRFSAQHHYHVIFHMQDKCNFVGTSNIHFARLNNIKPIGTQAHEWIMFHGAKYGYREANRLALKHWVRVYHGNLGIALADTYGTNDFFRAFGSKYSKLFDGVRHDSGDPIRFGEKVILHYEKHGIDPKTKTIVFSDGLTPEKIIEIDKYFVHKIKRSYGIGTNLTNDIQDGAKPLNMVIKMTHCKPYGESEWLPGVKLSDDKGKHTGDPEEIEFCKRTIQS